MRNLPALTALTLAFAVGGLTDAIAHVFQQNRICYHVQIAGSNAPPAAEQLSLVDAEYSAHRLITNPETEQEMSRPVLILDQDNHLVDTIQ